MPPSCEPWPAKCLSVAKTLSGASGRLVPGSRARRRRRAARRDTDPRRRSPRCGPSADRGRDRRPATSTCCTPRARASCAAALITRSTSAGSQVLASAIGTGNDVPRGATRPCSASSWNITGMPSRVFSMTHFCRALMNSACFARRARRAARRRARDLARARHLAEAVSEQRLRAGRVERARGRPERRLALPDALELRDLLLERHAREQIGDACLDRLGGILVFGVDSRAHDTNTRKATASHTRGRKSPGTATFSYKRLPRVA